MSENSNEIETKSQQLTNRKRINCHLQVAWIESANINIQSNPTLVAYISIWTAVFTASPFGRLTTMSQCQEYPCVPGSLNSQRCSHSISACLPTAGGRSPSEIKSWMRKQGKQWVSKCYHFQRDTEKILRFLRYFLDQIFYIEFVCSEKEVYTKIVAHFKILQRHFKQQFVQESYFGFSSITPQALCFARKIIA